MTRIVVIGGGVSGLACARGLIDRLSPSSSSEVIVLEAAPRPGGPVRSDHADGFVCEAGPHGFLDNDPATIVLAERVGLRERLLPTDDARRGRFLFFGDRLHPFPEGPRGFFTSELLSRWGRARLLLEPLLRSTPADRDESVGAFARRKLGDEVAERLIEPIVCGIYGGDMDRLSLSSIAPQFADMAKSRQSLLLGAMRARRRGAPATKPRRLVSFTGGIGELVRALADSIGAALRCDSPVLGLSRDRDRWRVAVGGACPYELLADAVISAVPAPRARVLLAPLDADLGEALGSIRYLPAAMVALGFRREDVAHPLNGFGYLVPRTAGGSVLGVLWPSSMFPGTRSPDGTVLLQAIVGGARLPDICDEPDTALEAQVCAQLRLSIGVRGAPMFRRVYRHRPGLPQYEVGHQARVARVEAAQERLAGLYITGNAFRGVGINACTADAEKIVDRVVVALERRGSAAAPTHPLYSNTSSAMSRQPCSP